MPHSITLQAEKESCEMQFIQRFEPPIPAGCLKVKAEQQVEITGDAQEQDRMFTEKQFQIAYRAFTMDVKDVWSVSPANQDSGKFANQLPHITLKNKCFPWLYETKGQAPWVALLAVTHKEQQERDITIQELLEDGKEPYFPTQAQPSIYLEKGEDVCHVVDIDRSLFLQIAPNGEERSLLSHGKFLNLLNKSDDQVEMDGFFSCIIGSRFIPSETGETIPCTVHLVSMLGYEDLTSIPDTCKKVRLVSLYRWDVFSQGDAQEGFTSLMEELDCGTIGINCENDWLRQGYVPKRHLFRSGESTLSLYRGPLLPFENQNLLQESPKTSDGAMVFHPELGMFDVSFSTAWQMGRLLTLQDRAISEALVQWRKEKEKSLRRQDVDGFLRSMAKEAPAPSELASKAVEAILTQIGGEDETLDV